jgi:hypothetical protein
MEADSVFTVFLTRVHRGILQAACSRSPESAKMIHFFYSCPWSSKRCPHLPTPRLLSTKPVGTSTHQNTKSLQHFVEPDISASARRSCVSS